MGTVSATNVIFKNGVAVDDTSYGYDNAYGGAIYNYVSTDYYGYVTNVPKNTLYNCTFLNNSAMYGGAIYLPYGNYLFQIVSLLITLHIGLAEL